MTDDATSAEEVRRLYARYAHTVDDARFEEWGDCWVDDAVFDSPHPGRFEGRDAVVTMVKDFRVALDAESLTQRHIQANVTFELDGDRGTGRCNLVHIVTHDGASSIDAVGVYEDELRRVDGRWLFASRTVVLDA